MCRLKIIEPENANSLTKALFQKLVIVPNLLCIMANSDAVINSFAAHNANIDKYKLSSKYREIISLAVSQFNSCEYCIGLHTSNAVDNGLLTHEECLEARRMQSQNAKVNALLEFTEEILKRQGHVKDISIDKVRQQGFNDQDIIEITATIALITQANYTANIAKPEIESLVPPSLEEI